MTIWRLELAIFNHLSRLICEKPKLGVLNYLYENILSKHYFALKAYCVQIAITDWIKSSSYYKPSNLR